jgi:hypothetical protein
MRCFDLKDPTEIPNENINPNSPLLSGFWRFVVGIDNHDSYFWKSCGRSQDAILKTRLFNSFLKYKEKIYFFSAGHPDLCPFAEFGWFFGI